MVSQMSCSGGVQAVASLREDYFDYVDRVCKPQSLDARSDDSGRTMDEAVDLEVLAYMAVSDAQCCYSPRSPSVSGLPLVCSNCGVSFFSLQIPDDQVDCYCSGECKWSVIMYREMDLRMFAMRKPTQPLGSTCSSSSFYGENDDGDDEAGDSFASFSFSDDSTASSSCCSK
ncbi:hypothetical protein PRIC1_009550 [Phytophthora ramorum]|uniref:FLZ-type domain-containing protein n=1 Tax=Phytophthora ramorum TaxID=164328 RepID=H3GNP6_PHYRM|nr:hypothetical protein KRP23_5697 [Phytophthora ramorum]KAH7481997.1 hypothetical protein KRP23_5172 [Phytophthora ramorum]KAH7504591.1 hypothetical protein KRP22_5081 [Phytophthora ramorum]